MYSMNVKPGDKFALAAGPWEPWLISAYRTVTGYEVSLVAGDILTAADPPEAVGGLWVHEPRLDGSQYAKWAWLTPVSQPATTPTPCRCNIMIGPCRCGAFQREMED